MKTSKSPSGLKTFKGGVLLMLAISSASLTQMAQAATSAAGTVLRNSVTVDYDDVNAVAQPQESTFVDVTVDLVGGVAWGATVSPATQTIQSAEAISTYTITLTNTGNGSDEYTITDNTSESCTTGTLGVGSFTFDTTPRLGATVSAAAGVVVGPNTSIDVSNMTVADFTAGDTVIIGGSPFVVVSATAGALVTDPDTLVVVGAPVVASAGVQIGEQIDFTYDGTVGALSGAPTPGVGCEHTHELVADDQPYLTALSNTNTNATATSLTWTTIVEGVQLSVVKYVRNTDAAKNAAGVAAPAPYATYYTSGVTGNPGDTLEYIVVITNDSTGDAQNVVFNDTLPNFTTYEADSIEVDTNGDGTFETAVTGETEGVTTGIIVRSGQNITVYPGVGGSEATATGGVVQDVGEVGNDPANQTVIRYNITID